MPVSSPEFSPSLPATASSLAAVAALSAEDLAAAPPPAASKAADADACRQSIRCGSLTFHAASLFLPSDRRDPCYALYAFCRLADDAVDNETGGPAAKSAACQRLRERLDRAYAGQPWPDPVDRAFAGMVRTHALPRALPEALLEGMEWDALGRQYDDLSGLRAYAARVAAVVGAMMTVIMGVRDPVVLARACDLGVAMQLTNICRDVGEDARAGRLFLPRDWMVEAGLDPEAWLANPVHSEALASVIARVLDEAEALYARALTGIVGLPVACRPAIQSAAVLYRAIGHDVARAGYDSVSRRAWVPTARKALLAARAAPAAFVPRPIDPAPPLPETAFLVDAVVAEPLVEAAEIAACDDLGLPRPSSTPWWRMGVRIAWTLDLFIEMDRRQQAPHLYA
ncbi:phytoene/squalene synthase family protein [Pararhodospirillum oryzae]|uniref:Phytoene synthase n=1 Tax=Pararhodospirillum oryzae TaxID=478448 RepID=A0A512H891_9PROT|nr:phytoene/squalene synthase family protein [Pararhodospirillum oryzae]GEO81667.1 phytoene synthase [Pararhodospirillum oryzae]